MKKSRTQLAKKSKANEASWKNELILEYAPLVKYIANRIAVRLPPQIEVGDLINSGILGLIDAIEKFDPSRDVKFKTYAEIRIRGAILDELRSLDWVPRSVRRMASRLVETYSDLEQKLGRPARDEEMAKALDIGVDEFYELLHQASGISLVSLDGWSPSFDQKKKLVDCLASEGQNSPLGLLGMNEAREIVSQAIEQLPQKERLVISLYYYDELTMKEIGHVLDLTESRVSQIHTKAILRLRGRLRRRLPPGK